MLEITKWIESECVLCKCVLQESYEQNSIFRSGRIYECVFTCLCLIMHLQQMLLSLFAGRWIGVVCMSVHVCVCVCVCLSLASYKDNGTVEGFSWQTDRNTDGKWLDKPCLQEIHTHNSHTRARIHRNTHTSMIHALRCSAFFPADPDFMLSLWLDVSLITLLMLGFDWLTGKVVGLMVKGHGLRLRLMCVKTPTGCGAGLYLSTVWPAWCMEPWLTVHTANTHTHTHTKWK